MKYYLNLVLIFFVIISASAQSSEDILKYLPTYEYTPIKPIQTKEIITTSTTGLPLPAYNNSLRVNSLLDSIYAANKNIKFMEGYRIQVFNGDNKDEANAAKEFLYKIYPNADIYTIYKQPTYKVKLGDFTNRHEAKRILEKKILKSFPKAILIQDNIFIKRKIYYD